VRMKERELSMRGGEKGGWTGCILSTIPWRVETIELESAPGPLMSLEEMVSRAFFFY
jgi:hypothetical protein